MKLDLLTNATVVDDAIRFVSQKSKEGEDISSNYGELNYREKQEEGADELYEIASKPTLNKTF
jgi:hypothetical protein